MSEEVKIEEMRYELGRDFAQKGEPLHEGASEEFYHGYTDVKKSAWSGSSNVMPRQFGKGGSSTQPWICLCGHHNPRYIRHKCWKCGVEKSVVDHAKTIPG